MQASVLDSRGVALFAIGRFEDALASYDRALSIKPENAETLYHRGLALANLWRYDEAIVAWQRALTIDPRHPHAFGALAFYQLMVCNWTETERIAKELERLLAEESAVIEPFTLLAYSVAPAQLLRQTRRYVRDRMPTMSQLRPVRTRQPFGQDTGRLSLLVVPASSDRMANRGALRASRPGAVRGARHLLWRRRRQRYPGASWSRRSTNFTM